MKSETGEDKEREKGWVIADTRVSGERGGEQAHGLLWVPKERIGSETIPGSGSPSLFPSSLSLSFVNHESPQSKRGSPSMVYLSDTKAFMGDSKVFLGEAKLYGGGRSGGGAGGGGGEKQMTNQQFSTAGGGATGGGGTGGSGGQQEGKGGAKEESQSLLRVGHFKYILR